VVTGNLTRNWVDDRVSIDQIITVNL